MAENFINEDTDTLFVDVPEEGEGSFGKWLAINSVSPRSDFASSGFLHEAYGKLNKKDTAILSLLAGKEPTDRIPEEIQEKAKEKLEEVL